MTFAQSVEFYERQANAALNVNNILERMTANIYAMTDALDRTVSRMEELLTSVQKTASASTGLKTPFDTIIKATQSKAQGGLDDFKKFLVPQNLVLSLAIGVGWELFGDDIMTLLGPAMGVLESFAGVVHSVFATLAPVFTPVLWAAGLLTQILDCMASNMSTLLPVVAGLAGAMLAWNAQTVAGTIATAASTAAAWLRSASIAAQLGVLNLLTMAQGAFNTVMNASPAMKAVGVVMLLLGMLSPLIEKTDILKIMWEKITDFFSWVSNGLGKLFGKETEITQKMTVNQVPEKQKMAEATIQTQEQAYSAMTPPTIPD